jgi:hypothetical protein
MKTAWSRHLVVDVTASAAVATHPRCLLGTRCDVELAV